LFVSLDVADHDGRVAETTARGVDLKSASWGYDLAIMEDPDGDRLWFPRPQAAP